MARSVMRTAAALLLALASLSAQAQSAPVPPPGFDPALAARTGANEMGMRAYVLVILKSSSTPVPPVFWPLTNLVWP